MVASSAANLLSSYGSDAASHIDDVLPTLLFGPSRTPWHVVDFRVAGAMAAVCAPHGVPTRGARTRGDLFSVA